MRIRVFLHSATLLASFLSSALAAQQFQAPSTEELKMTADPKAPGADAVILELRETDDDERYFRTIYERIKVLTEKGKDLASVEIPFVKGDSKVSQIKARTIHSDGTVIPLEVKPEDLLSEKTRDLQLKRKVFTLPDVEVGSILEYQYEINYHDNDFYAPDWKVQRDYFVRKAHFEFHSASSLDYTSRLPAGIEVKHRALGVYTLDASDIPPVPDEEWMPPVESLLYGVKFYYADVLSSDDDAAFWRGMAQLWTDAVDGFAAPSKTIKAAVDGLVSASDSDLDKARKLYAAVQALDNTDYSREKGASERHVLKLKDENHAEDTWKQKSGSSDEIALLYLGMLRAAGMTAYAVEVVDRDKGIFDPSDREWDQLDSMLVILSSGGKEILLDPGEKMCPFGTVSWRHSQAGGLRQIAKGTAFAITVAQQYKDNITRRTGVLTLTTNGQVNGQLQIAMIGQESLRWRQTALRNDVSEVEKEFNDELDSLAPEGVQARVDRFEGIENADADLIAVVNVSGVLGATAARRLLLPGFFFETRGKAPFVSEAERLMPVDMHYAEQVSEQITYRLPAGVIVEGAPQDANVSWPSHALLVTKSLAQAGEVTIAQTLTRGFTVVKPAEYQDLRKFYQKVSAADQETVVLTENLAAQAN